MQISKLWVSGCRWKRVFVWLQIFSTLELCITNTCFVCSCQKSVLWEHYEQVSKWEDKSFSLLLLQVRQGIFGRYWRLIMNYAENCLKIKPQSKIKLSNMLKPLEHHRTCLVTVIFVEMFDGLWKSKPLQWLWLCTWTEKSHKQGWRRVRAESSVCCYFLFHFQLCHHKIELLIIIIIH